MAVEYLKRLRRIEPYTTRRKGDGYHQSASQIRSELAEREPERFARMSRIYWELVSSRILQTDGSRLEQMFSAGEGLGNKLKKEVRCASSAEQLIMRVKSKAYTHSRISRLLTQVLLDIDEPDAREGQPYIRVLAFDRTVAAFFKGNEKKRVRFAAGYNQHKQRSWAVSGDSKDIAEGYFGFGYLQYYSRKGSLRVFGLCDAAECSGSAVKAGCGECTRPLSCKRISEIGFL